MNQVDFFFKMVAEVYEHTREPQGSLAIVELGGHYIGLVQRCQKMGTIIINITKNLSREDLRLNL